MSLDAILSRIERGESISPSDLVPYLCLERAERRADVNMLLARAYFRAGGEQNLVHAAAFIQRAWLLGRFSLDLLPLYTQIHAALGDVPAIREAYKRVGMDAAARGDANAAINYFNLWQWAYHAVKNLDHYEYDFDILGCLDRLALPNRLSPSPRADLLAGGKVRLAYLVKGLTEVGSVLIKINLIFARYHDRERFEPIFFAPDSEASVHGSEAGREHLALFASCGFQVRMARVSEGGPADRALDVARMIHDAKADVLVTGAALAHLEHYFVTSLRPAPVAIGLIQGPPPQFASPNFDGGLAWSKHPLIDCPVSCVRIRLRGDLPERANITPYEKGELGIPEGAVVVASAGRHVKFQEPAFWRAVVELLDEFPQTYYLCLGAEESDIAFLPSLLTPAARERIRFMGWRGDSYLRGLCMADLLIDTFPSGGGGTLLDPLALGIPCVSFENNYMRLYDQTDWSLADEFIKIPELIAPRGDFERLKRAAGRLITDPDYRREMARRSQQYALETRTNAPLSIRECENAYLRFIERKMSGDTPPLEAREAEVRELRQRVFAPRQAPRWVAATAHQLKRVLRLGERVLDRVSR